MAHLTVNTLVTESPQEVADAQNANETNETLRAFANYAVGLRSVLYEDKPLNEMELLFIENHFHVLRDGFSSMEAAARDCQALTTEDFSESGESSTCRGSRFAACSPNL